jgi:hypothetical protein
MGGDVIFLEQLVNVMQDAVIKLEAAKNTNKIDEVNRLKSFILDIQKKINDEISKELI